MSTGNDDKRLAEDSAKPSVAASRDMTADNHNDGLIFEAGLKALEKVPSNRPNLNVPPAGRLGRSQSSDTLSLVSLDEFSELRRLGSAPYVAEHDDELERDESPPLPGWTAKIKRSWIRNKGLVWVILAQAFGAGMNVSARLLESQDGGNMHPLQIMFVRMLFTTVLSFLYMWWDKTPHFPLGAKEVRGLLVARGLGGFFGVFGIYWSLRYLPVADSTVLTFLAPVITCYVCAKLLNEPFSRAEQIGAFASLIGVVLIAQPAAIFSSKSSSTSTTDSAVGTSKSLDKAADDIISRALATSSTATSAQRLGAVGVAMIGVIGAAIAYVTIRWIGNRAHALISVNYLAVWCLVISTLCLAFVPSISFVFPSTLYQWSLLFVLGIGGFCLQFLLTAGLRYEKSSRATNMVYSSMLFALAADKIIWNDTPGIWSLAGSGLILGSAVVTAVQKAGAIDGKGERGVRDEEAAMMEGTEAAMDDSIEMPGHERLSEESTQSHSADVDTR